MVEQLLLNSSPGRDIVKGNFAFGTGLGFLTQFEDSHLKYGIGGENSKSNTSGRKIAWGPPKILPTLRCSGQIFLDPFPKD
jgi:hypothetical protein